MHPRPPSSRGLILAALLGTLPTSLLAAPPAVSPASLTAYAWGENSYGQVGNGLEANYLEPVTAPVPMKGVTGGVTAISAGSIRVLAVQKGTALAWVYDSKQNIDVPTPVKGLESGVTAVAAGNAFSLAIQSGAVLGWGYNGHGRLGNGTETESSIPVPVTGLAEGVTAIATCDATSLAIQNGAARAWGFGGRCQLGNGSQQDSLTPVQVTGLQSGITAIAAGHHHSLAVQNGAVFAWGTNTNGELGDGSTTQSATPVPVKGLTDGVTSVATGGNHSLAVRNGAVFAWGRNDYKQLGTGFMSENTSVLLPIQVDPDHLKHIVQVAAGWASSYALDADGSLWVWGDDSQGELGRGINLLRYAPRKQADDPRHVLPPKGLFFRFVDANATGIFAVAILGDQPPGLP